MRGPTVSFPTGAGPGSIGPVRCVPGGAGYPLTVPAPSGPEPLPDRPRSGRQPIARGGSPWIPAPTIPLEPPKGATGRPPRTRTGRPFGACDPLLGAGIPRLPPGAIGGRLLPEPDGTRPGLSTTGRTPRPHTRPTSMPHNHCPLAPRCRLPWVRGPVIWTAMTSRTSTRVGPSVTRGVSASSSRRGPAHRWRFSACRSRSGPRSGGRSWTSPRGQRHPRHHPGCCRGYRLRGVEAPGRHTRSRG